MDFSALIDLLPDITSMAPPTIFKDENGLEKVQIKDPHGSSAEVYCEFSASKVDLYTSAASLRLHVKLKLISDAESKSHNSEADSNF